LYPSTYALVAISTLQYKLVFEAMAWFDTSKVCGSALGILDSNQEGIALHTWRPASAGPPHGLVQSVPVRVLYIGIAVGHAVHLDPVFALLSDGLRADLPQMSIAAIDVVSYSFDSHCDLPLARAAGPNEPLIISFAGQVVCPRTASFLMVIHAVPSGLLLCPPPWLDNEAILNGWELAAVWMDAILLFTTPP
jgi:hypothetical protein